MPTDRDLSDRPFGGPTFVAWAEARVAQLQAKAALLRASGVRPPVETNGLCPPRNGPCPCGSGRKYKLCCRKVIPYAGVKREQPEPAADD